MERRIVTVLFADLVGFTTLSELLDAEDVAAVQDAYFAGIRDAVGRHGGRVEKFIGDAAVAAFGADRTREDDAERAVRAGLAIVALVASLGARLGLDEDALDVRVGVQTGEVAVATDGPDQGRLTGDTMNSAARFQAAATPGTVLCGRPTVLATAHAIAFGALTPFTLKGKAEPALAAVAEGPRPEASRAAAMGALHADLVGRDTELAALAGAWARIHGGATERWTVIADPGVGKSRLLAELRSRAEAAGAAVWTTRLRAGEVAPFAVVGRLVRSALGDDPDPLGRLAAAGVPAERAAVLAAEAAGLAHGSVGRSTGSPADLTAARTTRFRAWLELLDALAAGRPQVWQVEDVHWAGGDLLAFLARAGSVEAPGGRLVMTTTRPTLLETAPDWPGSDGGHRLDLRPLAEPAAAALVRALVGDAVPDHLVATLVARADGNPLFIEELLRSWVSLGVLMQDPASGTWRLTVEPADAPMPGTVQALYAAQLDDLPPAAREVARRASVAGRRFAERLLAELGLPDGSIREGLALLLRGTLVDGPRPDPALGPGYVYRHALLRDAGYASLARAERVRLHRAVARWMASLPGAADTLAEPIGRQLAAAAQAMSAVSAAAAGGDAAGQDRVAVREDAAGWLTRAADRAVALAAHDAAATLLRDAIALSDPAAALLAATRRLRLADVLAASGTTEEAAPLLDEARTTFAARLDGPVDSGHEEAAAARVGYAAATVSTVRLLLERLRFRDALDAADEAIGRLTRPGTPDDLSLTRIRLERAHAELYETNASGPALDEARRVTALAMLAGDRELELDALRLELAARSESGDHSPVVADRVVALSEALGRWSIVATTRYDQALQHLGNSTALMAPLLAEAERVASSRGLLNLQGWIAYGRAEAAFLVGEWDEAMRQGRAALDVALANGYHRIAVRTWFAIRPIALHRGDATMLRELGDWLATFGELPDSPYGRLMRAAVDQSVAAGTGADPAIPDPDGLRDCWALTYDDPSFIAARDAVLASWWEDGRFDAVIAALDGMPPDADGRNPLARGAQLLWRARLGGDETEIVARAREALTPLRRWEAAWWIEQAIGVLDDAGDATPEERDERRVIRARLLGIPAG